MSSDQPADGVPEKAECPNCGGAENQTDDDDHRICWDCGTRWST